jgi:uncharacterized repeat protein (TIGR01451 family)
MMTRLTSVLLCMAVCAGLAQPVMAQAPVGNAPLAAAADPITVGYGVQTPAGDGVTAFNGEPITYTINLVNLTGAAINNISVFNPLPEDTLDSLVCTPVCGQSVTTRTIPDPLGGVIQVTRTLAVSWTIPTLNPGAGAGVQLQLVARVIGRMAGTSFSSSAVATFKDGAVGSNTAQVIVAARPRNSSGARIESAPTWFSADAGGTLDQDWGDVNRDGALDLALASSIGTSVYRNNAGLLTRIWSVPQMSYGAKWADVDGDGVLELVIVGDSDDKTAQSTGRNRIYKYNLGTGALNLMSEFTSTRQLVRVAVADLNRDGFIDIVGSTNAIAVDCPVVIFINNGAGQFPPAQALCPPNSKATAAISLGDMNNDDRPDLALGAFPNGINIRVNGTLTTSLQASVTLPITTDLSFLPYDFSWGDFDNDGFLDLAAAFPLDRQARIYRNIAAGGGRTLTLQQILPNLTFMTPLSVDWADIEGDGRLDLVVSGSPSVVYVRNSTGRFVLNSSLGANIGGGQVWEARAAETRIDQGSDLVFTNRDRASMMFDVIAPRMASAIDLAFGTDVLPASHVALADIDRNGFLDMLQGANDGNVRTRAFLNIDGTFPGFSVFPTLLGPQRIAVADVNSDSVLEVAIGDRTQLNLYTSNGTLLRTIVVPANGPFVPAWGDANDDGLLDLFVASDGPTFVFMNNAGVLGNAPSFQTAETCPATPNLPVSGRSLAVMDVTGDRFMDFVVGCFGQPARLYRNNRDNTFSPIWSAPAGTPITDVALDDFNGDGRPDLAVANDGMPSQVYENTGSTFAASPIWNTGTANRTMGIAWGDWNNDGFPELATANFGGSVEAYANLNSQPGRPQLQRVWVSQGVSDYTSVAWGDMDRDGDLDLVSTGAEADATGIFRNTINQPFQLSTPGEPLQQTQLPRQPVYVSLNRPGNTSDAFFNSTSSFLTNPSVAAVPVNFTVYGPDGSRANAANATAPVQGLAYEYSVDGGSTWQAATPLSATAPITQATRAGVSGTFLWNARADKAISDNAHFRVRVIAKAPAGPVQRASSSAITPPFRLRSTTCFWAETASMVVSPTLPAERQVIQFAAGQVGGSGPITFSWQFGDGNTRIGQIVNYSYTVAGTYNVSLTVTGAACPITRPLTINMPMTVTAGPTVYTVYMPMMFRGGVTRTAATQAPAVVVDLAQQVTALDGTWANGALRLAWRAPTGAQPDGYRVHRSAANENRVLLAELPAAQRAFTDEAAPCGAAYDVTWVRDGVESLPGAATYYTSPCAAATKQPAGAPRVGRFNLTRTTPAQPASPAAVINAPASLLPMTVVTPTTTKVCDLPANVMPPAGGLPIISSQPALNAGGRVVAFWSTGNLDPRSLNADGSIELYAAYLPPAGNAAVITQVTNSSGSILGGFNLWPSVSADGTKIAFSSDRDLTGGNPEANFEGFVATLGPNRAVSITQISSTPAGVALVPSLSANGNQVAFASDGNFAGLNADRSLEIYIANLAGATVASYTQVTQSPATTLNDQPSISDNGQRVTFVQREFSDVQDVFSQTVLVWAGDISPSTLITVDTSATDARPAISGDGRYVAFVRSSNVDGPWTLSMFDVLSPTAPLKDVEMVVRECKPFISRDGDRVGCINSSNEIAVHSPARLLVTTGGSVGNNAQPTLASNGDTVAYINNDNVAWITCRSADLALVLPVSNSVPARAGQLVTMTVPVSNFGPSASPTTTLFYTFTSLSDENIFVAGKPPSTTITGSVTHVGNIAANSIFSISVPLSTTEFSEIAMDWRVEGSADDPVPTNNTITSNVIMQADVRFNIALAVSSVPTQNVRAGSPITYTIVLTNIGTSRANGVALTNTLPAETSFVAITHSTTAAGTVVCGSPPTTTLGETLACNLTGSRLPGGGVISLTLQARVTDTALGPLTHVVSATAIELAGVASRTLTTTVLPQADLQVGVVVSPARPATNDISFYTVFVTNTGRVTVTDALISVTLPANATFVAGSSTAWNVSQAGRVISTSPVSIGAQSARTLTYTINVSPEVQIGDLLTTTAFVTSTSQAAGAGSFDPNPTNNIITQVATANRVSDFSVSLEASPLVIAGQEITYVVVYTNAGPSIADVVTVSVSAPLLQPAETQIITVTSLGVGVTGTAEFTATVGGNYITPVLTSTAFITSVNSDNILANNRFDFASAVTSSADISVAILSATTAVTAGNRVTYTVAFSNPGPSNAVNFVAVFSATGAVSFTAPAGWVKVSDTQISLTLASLAAGESPTFTLTGTVPSFAPPGNVISLSLSAGSDTPDPELANNAAVTSTSVAAQADVRVLVTPQGTAIAGLPFTFTVAYSNTGPSDAINTQVVFTTPVNFPILSAPVGWSVSPGNVAARSIPTFAPGGTISAIIVVSIPATSMPAFNSVLATINSTTPDPSAGDNSSNPSFNITRSANVSITVIAPDVSDNGKAYQYTVVMTNFGPSSLPSQQFSMTWSPALRSFTSVSPGWNPLATPDPDRVQAFASINPLAAGASSTAIVSVRLPRRGDSVTATLGVSTPGATDPVLGNNTTTKFTSLAPVLINPITLTAGSATVVSGTMATFTVTVGPENVTLPLTYTWLVPNVVGTFTNTIDGDVITDETVTRNFTWTVLGPQTVIVTATNGFSSLSASRTITVTPVLVAGVALDGPATVTIGANAPFTATVSPVNATTPITYSWLASNQVGLPVPPGPGGITNARSFSWNVLGPQVVTVTANNGATVIATRTVTVLPVNLASVVISTPVSIRPSGATFTFTATAAPANATQPITYVWSAANQTPVTQAGGGLSSTQVFTWNVLGPQVVTVTATNQGNTVTNTFVVTMNVIAMTNAVLASSVDTAPTGATIHFTATVQPVSSTLPINYTWSATGQSTQVQSGVNALSSSIVFGWPTAGTKVVTVTANNGGSTVIATRTITVTNVNLTSVGLSTPAPTAQPGTPFTFTANVLPLNATLPITYTWSATNQSPQTVTGGGVSAQRVLTWNVAGPQTVTVTATNAGNTVTATLIVTPTPINLTSVTLATPQLIQTQGTPFNFTADVLPVNATQPITYVWSATNQTPVTQAGGGASAAQAFTWSQLGPQVVTVTATNLGNTVTATLLVTVTPVNLTDILISVPAITAPINTAFNFTANAQPLNATLPITYVWSADGQTPVTQAGGGISSPQAFTWSTPGTYAVTVTASNAGNTVTGTTLVTVTQVPLSSVSISTPLDTQPDGSLFNFSASVLPASAGTPITYTWQATGQSPITQTGMGLMNSHLFGWTTPGVQVVTVTASNSVNAVSASMVVTVTPIALTSVFFSSLPSFVTANTSASFGVVASPLNASLPLTYTWSASNQATVVNGPVNTTSDSVNYTWSLTGTETVTVVVSNAHGDMVTSTVQIIVNP